MTTQQRIKVTLGHLFKRLKEVQHEHRQLTLAADALSALGRLDTIVRGGGRSAAARRSAGPGTIGEVDQHGRQVRRKPRKTRTMTAAQKREVSVRMKRYWARRRANTIVAVSRKK
jgi:hypothetical protein